MLIPTVDDALQRLGEHAELWQKSRSERVSNRAKNFMKNNLDIVNGTGHFIHGGSEEALKLAMKWLKGSSDTKLFREIWGYGQDAWLMEALGDLLCGTIKVMRDTISAERGDVLPATPLPVAGLRTPPPITTPVASFTPPDYEAMVIF